MHGHDGFVHYWRNLQEDSMILALEPLMTLSDISRRVSRPQAAWGGLVRRPLPVIRGIDCQPEAVICQDAEVSKAVYRVLRTRTGDSHAQD